MWTIVKAVEGQLVGCVVGPFATQEAADAYGIEAGKFNLGYEQWVSRELQAPSPLIVPERRIGKHPALAAPYGRALEDAAPPKWRDK